MSSTYRFAAVLAATTLLAGALPASQPMIHQGRLLSGAEPATGPVDLEFLLHDAPDSLVPLTGSVMYQHFEEFDGNGFFSVELPFEGDVFDGTPRWLEVIVDGVPLTPFVRLGAAPHAYVADSVMAVPGGALGGEYPGAVALTNPDNAFVGDGSGLEGLDASAISAGTLAPERLPQGGEWTLAAPLSIGPLVLDPAGPAIGLGVQEPEWTVHVSVPGDAAVAWIESTKESGGVDAVLGRVFSNTGVGIRGWATPASGSGGTGVSGRSDGRNGTGVFGFNFNSTGTGIGVRGQVSSPDAWAAHFTGPDGSRNYFQRRTGFGTFDPQAMVHVAGTLRVADGTEGEGRILASDADGTAGWIEPSTLSGLDAAGIATGILPSDRLAGDYPGITGVGPLSSLETGAIRSGPTGLRLQSLGGGDQHYFGANKAAIGNSAVTGSMLTVWGDSTFFGPVTVSGSGGAAWYGPTGVSGGTNPIIVSGSQVLLNSSTGPVTMEGDRVEIGATGSDVAVQAIRDFDVEALRNATINALNRASLTSLGRIDVNSSGGDLRLNEFVRVGLVGVGIGEAADAKLTVRGDVGEDALRVRVGGTTRLVVRPNGGVAIGSNFSTPPASGLRVAGNVAIGGGGADSTSQSLAINGGAVKPGGGLWGVLVTRSAMRGAAPVEPGMLDRLLRLRGYAFEYTEEAVAEKLAAPGRQIGLMGDEVAEVFPHWVTEEPDGSIIVAEKGLTAILVEAMRELRDEKDAEIQSLRETIDSQEQRLLRMEKQLEEMRALVLASRGQ